ncbi:hypothetical protein PINS_up001556 [Pythium insidiosum]|nr:hypothetical protein PINS_up001556 [Pythium insidiosum]
MRRFPAAVAGAGAAKTPRTPVAADDESDSVETVSFMGASTDESAEEVTLLPGDDERGSDGLESPSGQSSWSSASSHSDEEISPVAPSRDHKLQGILKHDRSERLGSSGDRGLRQRVREETAVRRSPRLQQTRESLAFMR